MRRVDVALVASAVLVAGMFTAQRYRAAPPPQSVAGEDLVAGALLAAIESGPGSAMALLQQAVHTNPALQPEGHHLAHRIGKLAVAAAGYDPTIAAACTAHFQSGCYHGVVQGYFEHQGGVTDTAVRSICTPLAERAEAGLAPLECAHGLGHGLNGVLEHDVEAALQWCDVLDDALREWCYGGVFMENLANAGAEHAGQSDHAHGGGAHTHDRGAHRHVREEDPLYPCSELDSSYLRMCYRQQIVVFLLLFGNDLRIAAKQCNAVPREFVDSCYEGLGVQAAGLHSSNHDRIRQVCGAVPLTHGGACTSAAADYLFAVEWSAHDAFRFCARVDPDEARDACYGRVGFRIGQSEPDPAVRAARCASAGKLGESACRNGAGVEPNG